VLIWEEKVQKELDKLPGWRQKKKEGKQRTGAKKKNTKGVQHVRLLKRGRTT